MGALCRHQVHEIVPVGQEVPCLIPFVLAHGNYKMCHCIVQRRITIVWQMTGDRQANPCVQHPFLNAACVHAGAHPGMEAGGAAHGLLLAV